MKHRQLPIGIQNFRTIREEDFYYVDKTPLIRNLVGQGRFYFLSRPRRFGKSLLVDTLKSLFEGSEELFRGLDIHGHWDWSKKSPVVRLSFGGKYNEPGDVDRSVLNQLAIIERNAGLPQAISLDTGPERFQDLLDRLHHATGLQVVVLVDEYDKPILDVLENPDLAKANRDYLRGFYGIIKDSYEHVRFVLVTGVSMFSKVNLFSGLNNLEDISLNPQFATICGYTDNDLDTVFAPELPGLDREEVRRWYNGYHWLGEEKVYNPFDVLLLFRNRKFRPWWFETGSPEFLFRLLMEKEVSPMELENREVNENLVSKFDVGDIGVDSLLFQTGYLTIVEEEQRGSRILYRLDYPNFEVRQSLNQGLLEHVTRRGTEAANQGEELVRLLGENDFEGFGERLRSFLAGIPYPWHASGDLGRYESWYASMLYMSFRTIGVDLRVEDVSSHGRADMVVFRDGQIFVLEFKMTEGERDVEKMLDRAMAQMRERGYGEKYRDRGEPTHLVGLVFGGTERNLLGVRAETP
ncbi:MAG: AAA family ATPase [Gammaproteobacteria bacterium]|nr:AAA family ATPase [Gammaproteobacteria bacterium]MYG65345.1 AAA family ATPase [Gammaproteobacteria bacterium]